MPRPPDQPGVLPTQARAAQRTAKVERRPAPAASSGGITYAYASSLFIDIADSTGASFDLDDTPGNDNFETNDSANFSIASDGTNFGLAAANAGTYLVIVGFVARDKAGTRVANPYVVAVHAGANGSAWQLCTPQMGGFSVSGAEDSIAGHHIWTPSVTQLYVVGAGDPLVLGLTNNTGQVVHAYASVYAQYLSDSTAGV